MTQKKKKTVKEKKFNNKRKKERDKVLINHLLTVGGNDVSFVTLTLFYD